jgi:hypothetical protein
MMQSGAAELIDNDKGGPLLTSSSDEDEIVRKKKNVDLSMLSQNQSDDEKSEVSDRRSIKSLSDRLKLESMSVFYSKTMYPISLGLIADDEY